MLPPLCHSAALLYTVEPCCLHYPTQCCWINILLVHGDWWIHTQWCTLKGHFTNQCLCRSSINSVLCSSIHASPDKGQPCARITSLVISSCMLLRDFLLVRRAAQQTNKVSLLHHPPTPEYEICVWQIFKTQRILPWIWQNENVHIPDICH